MRKFLLVSLLCFVFLPLAARAGLGVSPAYLTNEHAAPGASFSKQLVLSRSNAADELSVFVELPKGLEKWIKIKQGSSFKIPKGVQQFPIDVLFSIPPDADYELKEGILSLVAVPVAPKEGGTVSVAQGAGVKVKINVSDKEFYSFKITGVRVLPMETGWPVRLAIGLENLGNVRVRPSNVHLEIHDDYRVVKILSVDIADLDWVEPFEPKEIIAEVKAELLPGQYWIDYEIYGKNQLLVKQSTRFDVWPSWTLVKKSFSRIVKDYLLASPFRIAAASAASLLLFEALIVLAAWLIKKLVKKKKKD